MCYDTGGCFFSNANCEEKNRFSYYFLSVDYLHSTKSFFSSSDDWRGSSSGSRTTSGFDSGFEGFDRKPSGTNLWEKEFEVLKTTTATTSKPKSDWGNTFDDGFSANNK